MGRVARQERATLPAGVPAKATPQHEKPGLRPADRTAETDVSWPPTPDHIQSINTHHVVVVCSRSIDVPHLEHTNACYTALERIVGSYSDETLDLETVLSEVERRWDSPRPGRCRGGVIAGDTCIQTHTKTPTAFLEDVAAAKQFVQSLPADLTRYRMSPYECRAALCWPVQPGHFYVEYEYQSENHFGGEREQLAFGLLLPDPLFDDSLVREFFAALDIDPPLYQRQWPYQVLVVQGGSEGVPVEPIATRGNDTDEARRLLHAENPLYGVNQDDLRVKTRTDASGPPTTAQRLSMECYRPLQHIDSLGYDKKTDSSHLETHHLDEIAVINPPGFNSTWVNASLDTIWSQHR